MKAILLLWLCAATSLAGAERIEKFDTDPHWEEHNSRAVWLQPRSVRQDFGYSPGTSHCGDGRGEMGGFINPAAEPAYYAREIPQLTLADPMSASGKVVCAGRAFHVLIGFFNAGTINEWRTPNTIAIRLQGRGDILYAYVEYTTARWRAGGDSPGGFQQFRDPENGRMRLKGFPTGPAVHEWSLRYDPAGNRGKGSIRVGFDGEVSICHLDEGHQADGAAFNRFGLLNVMKQWDTGGEIWLDDVTVNGQMESFRNDPHWVEFQNRRTYSSTDVRPRFDFGYSATHYAGGQNPGEMGGLIFRGDGRYTNLMAFYGAPLEEMNMTKTLKASGKISLRRAVSDSDVLIGFFHSQHSLESGGSDKLSMPPDFIGVTVGGPSREGFQFVPAYRLHNTERRSSNRGPYIYPNGASHDWTFAYDGVIRVTLDGQPAVLEVPPGDKVIGAHYNRFGIISTHTDGNGQHLYLDDVVYTWKQ
jgi:hypothetical protein